MRLCPAPVLPSCSCETCTASPKAPVPLRVPAQPCCSGAPRVGAAPGCLCPAGAGTASPPHLWVLGGAVGFGSGGSLWWDNAAHAKGISFSAIWGFPEGGCFFKYGLRVVKVLRLSVKIATRSSQRSSYGFAGTWAEQNGRPGDLKSSNINVTEKIMFDRKQRFTTNVSSPWGLTGRLPRTFLIKRLGISSGGSKQGRVRRTDAQGRGPAVTEHVRAHGR